MKIILALSLVASAAFAQTNDDLQKAIALAPQMHGVVANAKDATENSDILKQIDALITPSLNHYTQLKPAERERLAQAMVLAAQGDSSYSLASEHRVRLKRYTNLFSKDIENLIGRQTLTRAQADLFWTGIELSDASL